MAKYAGRDFQIWKGSPLALIAGATDVNMAVAGAPIDVTDQNDSGITNFLADVLTGRQISFSFSGYEEDQVFQELALSTTQSGWFLDDIEIRWGNGATMTGNFVMTAYNEQGPQGDGHRFDSTVVTDGAWTFTAAP